MTAFEDDAGVYRWELRSHGRVVAHGAGLHMLDAVGRALTVRDELGIE